MKYYIGSVWFMKKNYKGLLKEDLVKIVHSIKEGRYTFVDVLDDNGKYYYHVNVKILRRRKH